MNIVFWGRFSRGSWQSFSLLRISSPLFSLSTSSLPPQYCGARVLMERDPSLQKKFNIKRKGHWISAFAFYTFIISDNYCAEIKIDFSLFSSFPNTVILYSVNFVVDFGLMVIFGVYFNSNFWGMISLFI